MNISVELVTEVVPTLVTYWDPSELTIPTYVCMGTGETL